MPETGFLRLLPLAGYSSIAALRRDRDLVLIRARRSADDARILLEATVQTAPEPRALQKLECEFALRMELDRAWALRPVAQESIQGRRCLIYDDPGGEPLSRLLDKPCSLGESLLLALRLTWALRKLHAHGIIHKDLKPDNALVDEHGTVRLMGFGLASRLPRERQGASAPSSVGSLAYMSPEQTGRMNRSVDSRSDLYSLGITLYELFVGARPFEAYEPLEWVHCHIAHRPIPPHERRDEIPPQLSALVMKLLAKTADERYQTAAAVEADLQRCLEMWNDNRSVVAFPLARRDVPTRLMASEKLYGREREVSLLLEAFARVETSGEAEVVLVSGNSGVGKSSLVGELQLALVGPRGLLAAGKFDAQRRTERYFTFVQAMRSLLSRILAAPRDEAQAWRSDIVAKLGGEGRVLTDLLPELELVIGPQPEVPALSLVEARNRLYAVFSRLLAAFARAEHPLVLFLDDLQWFDAASLGLLGHIVTDSGVKHLLLVGAYRDNELEAGQPLARTLDGLRASSTRTLELRLGPLDAGNVAQLVSDTLHCQIERANPLAAAIHDKTAGNPFFVVQFLRYLEEKQLLRFDPDQASWTWDMPRIRGEGITENVVELVAKNLEGLPPATLSAVKWLACIGSSTHTAVLARASGHDAAQVRERLWPAVLAGVLCRDGDTYRFPHDRIREAAYSLIAHERRPATHLQLARQLLRSRSEPVLEEEVFLLVDQFSRGLVAGVDAKERAEVVRLSVQAGRLSLASAAFEAASVHLARARALLADGGWEHAETLALLLDAAESDFMIGLVERAESLFSEALAHARSPAERGEVHRRRAKLRRITGRYGEALGICVEGLGVLGVSFPPPGDEAAIMAAIATGLARVVQGLKDRRIADLAEVASTEDHEAVAVSALAAEALGPAYYGKSPYVALAALTGATVALERGPSADSPILYNVCAYLLSAAGDVGMAEQVSEMALRLHERIGSDVTRGELLVSYATLAVWRRPFASCADLLEEAFLANVRVGNVSSAGDAAMTALLARFEAGERIERLVELTEQYLTFARSSRNEPVAHTARTFSRFLDSLRSPKVLTGEEQVAAAERELAEERESLASYEKSGFSAGIVMLHVLREISTFVWGDFAQTLERSRQAEPHVANVLFTLQERNQPLFRALAAAGLHDEVAPDARPELSSLVSAALEPLSKMAESGPANFADRLALVQAEAARIEGRDQDAMRLYEKSVRSAREQGLVHREAIACEVAARFYAARGFETIARAYLRDARGSYLRWGALGKVRQLDMLNPELVEHRLTGVEATASAPLEDLDLLAVVSASQAVSGELVLERFAERLLTLMLRNAGAERGALIRPEQEGLVVEAEAEVRAGNVEVRTVSAPLSEERFPASAIRFALRTRARVLLEDATTAKPYAEDPYVIAHRPRSVFALPLLRQSAVVAILYLESRLATRAFAPAQVALVQLLASQAAISLENARLYRSLEQAEERFSKAFHRSPTPMAIFRMVDDTLVDANERFLASYGYTLDELRGRTLVEVGAVRGEDVARLRGLVAAEGTLHEEEVVVRNKQGKALVLLASVEPIEVSGELCALVTHVDVTERRKIESQLRQSQKMEAIGRLAGGVAHDFNNLLTAINGFGALALQDMPVSDANHETLQEILKAGERAAALTTQLLAHSRLQALQAKPWDLNLIVRDILPMLSRLIGEDIRLLAELEPKLALATVDRGQVEQVLLNLVVNARDALSPAGTITIATANADHAPAGDQFIGAAGPHVVLSVRDTGSGMTPEVKAKLFEPFFTTKPPGRGTGLGLSVVYGIVKQSGGGISVQSEPGEGTNFSIYFPATTGARAGSSVQQAERDVMVRGADATVLLVEDDAQVRKFARTALRAQGYRVVEAENGVMALQLLETHPETQLVVTDVVMPDMGGVALARGLRSLRPDLPILFVSGFAEHADVRGLIEASGGRLLSKPFTPFELARRVREALVQRR